VYGWAWTKTWEKQRMGWVYMDEATMRERDWYIWPAPRPGVDIIHPMPARVTVSSPDLYPVTLAPLPYTSSMPMMTAP
jgi:hypothetical protein